MQKKYKFSKILGKDYYRTLYQNELENEAEWLRRCAIEKVNSVQMLIERNGISAQRIIELGCGTGAVISECQRRGLAMEYTGVEYSPEAIAHFTPYSGGIELIQGDITDPNLHISKNYDIVILSHVLEHLENPSYFLCKMQKLIRFKYVIIEVPFEDLFISKIKFIWKNREINKTGHVQFFNSKTFMDLLTSNGLNVIDKRTYVPIIDNETIHFISEKGKLPKFNKLLKLLTNFYLPILFYTFWKNFYYSHHAVLCSTAFSDKSQKRS